MKFKKNDVVFEVRDTAHIAAFRAAGWQELTEPKTEETISEKETVKNAKPKRAKA